MSSDFFSPELTPPSSLTRRQFLERSAIFSGGALILPLFASIPLSAADSNPRQEESPVYWYRRPLRVLQTVLREPDAKDYDAPAVVEYMKKAACNTLVINAGGIVDFFKNPLPCANLNRFMGDRDLLQEITTACRAAGIRVIARADFRGVEDQVYQQHPDWFAQDASGRSLLLDYTTPKLHAGCYTCYYRNEHAEAFIKYLFEHYKIDGLWHNSIAVAGICYCPRCRESYAADNGGAAIPDAAKGAKEELARYMVWKTKVADRHVRRMRAAVKGFGEDKSYSAEVFTGMFDAGGVIGSGIDLYNARDHFDIIVANAFLSENNEVIRYEELYHSATLIRFLKSMVPEKEALLLYGDNGTSQRYIVDPMLDTRIWLWEGLSVGGHFWNCGFTGKFPDATDDRRGAYNSVPVYEFLRDHEDTLADQVPVANVGVYYSRSTRDFYRQPQPEGDRFDAAFQGMEKVLIENHTLYDLLADDQLSEEHLKRYRLIILPNVRCLSQREIDAIRRFVQNGGSLLATYATSLHDENGHQRDDFGLADVFGCHFTGKRVDTRKDCYQYILQPKHPLVAPDSPKTDILLNAGYTLLCKTDPTATVVATYIPRVNNQPPEKAWVPSWAQEYPTMIDHSFGTGRVIYFANQPDQINFDFGHQDAAEPLARAVRLLLGDSITLSTNAPGSVHAALTRSCRKETRYILSLVNLTSGPGRPVQRLIPVHELELTLQLPNATALRHEVLRAQGDCQVEVNGSTVRVRLSRLDDFFSLHLYQV